MLILAGYIRDPGRAYLVGAGSQSLDPSANLGDLPLPTIQVVRHHEW